MPAPTFRRGSLGQAAAEAEARQTTAPAARPSGALRANKFGAKCENCGVFVPEGVGMIEKRGAKWVVLHIERCPEPGSEENRVAQAAAQEPKHQVNEVKGQPLYDGIYTYETQASYRTFRLRTQGLDEEFMPGVQLISYLTGPDNERDYTGFGHVKGGRLYVWKKHQDKATLVKDAQAFMADPHAAHVTQSINCFRCGRTLTVPASVHNGLGPECARKGF